jgi:hypothetical protein
MPRTRTIAVALTEGVVVHLAATAAGLAGLAVWARRCERRRVARLDPLG